MEGMETSRHLSVGQSWYRILDIYASHFLVFTKISLATTGSFILIWALVVLPLARKCLQEGFLVDRVTWDDDTASNDLGKIIHTFKVIMYVIFKFLSVVFAAISMGSIVKAVTDVYIGKKKDSGYWCSWTLACLKHGLSNAYPLIILYTMSASSAALLSVIISPAAVGSGGSYYIYDSSLLIAGPVIVIEGKGPVESVLRSIKLLFAGNLCYSLCTYSVFLKVIALFLDFWWKTVLYEVAGANFYTTSGATLFSFPFLFGVPLVTIMQTVVYLNLRGMEGGGEEDGLNVEEPVFSSRGKETYAFLGEPPCSPAALEEPAIVAPGHAPPTEVRVSWLVKYVIFVWLSWAIG